MNKYIILFATFLVSQVAFGSAHHMIDTLGTSKKGQFVALEEYGYTEQTHSYYVRIKIMNVWTKEYVGKFIEVDMPAHRPSFLDKARDRAKIMAKDELLKYKIVEG